MWDEYHECARRIDVKHTNLHERNMRTAIKSLTISGLSIAMVGCAGLATQLPEISSPSLNAEKKEQEKRLFSEWDSMSERLLRVGRPILKANVDLCPRITPDIGVLTHDQDLYGKYLKEGSERELGASAEPSVLHISINGPAQNTELRRGDIIRNEMNKALDTRGIQKALAGQDVLKIDREGQKIPFSVPAETICGYDLILKQSAAVNAFANGRQIIITTGMMNFVETDEELAIIIGHELAHNTMGHIRKIIGNLILSGGATRYTRPFESEADYVGMYFSKRAGYNIDSVESFWRRLAVVHPRNVNRAKTHPIFPDRYLRLEATRKEIEQKLENDLPLFPNFKMKKKSKS